MEGVEEESEQAEENNEMEEKNETGQKIVMEERNETMEETSEREEKNKMNEYEIEGNNGSLCVSPNEKKRKSGGAGKDTPISIVSEKDSDSDKIMKQETKKRKQEAELMHAESQRLLRETKGAAFTPEAALRKPVSSLIEKIRLRKLQFPQSASKASSSNLNGLSKAPDLEVKDVTSEARVSLDHTNTNDEIEVVLYKPPTKPMTVLKQEPRELRDPIRPRDETINNTQPIVDAGDEVDDGDSSPSTPDARTRRSFSYVSQDSVLKSPPRASLRPPLIESQDLYSDSQLSPFEDSPDPDPDADVGPAVVPAQRLNLRFNPEIQDDRWLAEEDDEKENRAPAGRASLDHFPLVSNVRGLIDDEAEDEDLEGDLLQDDEMEDEDTTGELCDLLTQDAGEQPADIESRSKLHSKWLEHQDLALEDTIMHRIQSRWKAKGKKELPAILSETQGSSETSSGGAYDKVVVSTSVSSVQVMQLDASINNVGFSKGITTPDCSGQHEVFFTEDNELQESSDDEMAEEELRRQLFLRDSEEQAEFLSVADDDSSREIFSLINKVNVTTIKPRTATGHSDARRSDVCNHQQPLQHQSSFLRRNVVTTVTTTRRGSGNSRSYVFGRDDSNSRDASRSLGSLEQQLQKENSFTTPSQEQRLNSTAQFTPKNGMSGPKATPTKEAKPRGPSLFQILRQQAAELANGKSPLSLNESNSKADDLSIFMSIRPSKNPRGSRTN